MSQEDKCTETLEGDKIGCIYSVMIKMATTTNVQETTEDRRRQKYAIGRSVIYISADVDTLLLDNWVCDGSRSSWDNVH